MPKNLFEEKDASSVLIGRRFSIMLRYFLLILSRTKKLSCLFAAAFEMSSSRVSKVEGMSKKTTDYSELLSLRKESKVET